MRNSFSTAILLLLFGIGFSSEGYADDYWSTKFGVGCSVCHSRLDAAKAALNARGVVPGLRDFVIAHAGRLDTKPSISPIVPQWDFQVNQEDAIPLEVNDAEQDAFVVSAKPILPDAKFSDEYTADSGYPAVKFLWTPTADKANKVVTVTFTAQETNTNNLLKSSPVKAKIRVWPAGDRDQASVQKVMVSTAKWLDGKLTLKGKVTLNKMLSAKEKADFLNRKDFTVNITQGTNGNGSDIAVAQPITFDAKGGWALADLTLTAPFNCSMTVDFEGAKASRKIAGAPKDCIATP